MICVAGFWFVHYFQTQRDLLSKIAGEVRDQQFGAFRLACLAQLADFLDILLLFLYRCEVTLVFASLDVGDPLLDIPLMAFKNVRQRAQRGLQPVALLDQRLAVDFGEVRVFVDLLLNFGNALFRFGAPVQLCLDSALGHFLRLASQHREVSNTRHPHDGFVAFQSRRHNSANHIKAGRWKDDMFGIEGSSNRLEGEL